VNNYSEYLRNCLGTSWQPPRTP